MMLIKGFYDVLGWNGGNSHLYILPLFILIGCLNQGAPYNYSLFTLFYKWKETFPSPKNHKNSLKGLMELIF